MNFQPNSHFVVGEAANAPRHLRFALLVPVALLLLLVCLKPIPLVGGFTDDWQYLKAAQCLDCLPQNHWDRRFAIVWPLGIAIRLFGLNTWSAMLVPALAAVVAVTLVFALAERQYGRRAALIASTMLVLTPTFVDRAMRISIDVIELGFLLGAVVVLQRRTGHFWAGVLMALAVLCRPTQLAALPLVALLAWWQDKSAMKYFAAGFLTPLFIAASAYWVATGDPLYGWKLSLHHMQAWRASLDVNTYSKFISLDVDTSKSPLFNPAFIGGWRPLSGIHTHWTVQGLVNLMLSRDIGATLLFAMVVTAVAWRKVDRLQLALIGCAAFYFAVLTYAFAIDPRPRMYLPVVVIACTLIGALAPSLWHRPMNIAIGSLAALCVLVTLVTEFERTDYRPDLQVANRMLDRTPYQLTKNARQKLTLARSDFPSGGTEVMDIDANCDFVLERRMMVHRYGNVCIYGPPLAKPALASFH